MKIIKSDGGITGSGFHYVLPEETVEVPGNYFDVLMLDAFKPPRPDIIVVGPDTFDLIKAQVANG